MSESLTHSPEHQLALIGHDEVETEITLVAPNHIRALSVEEMIAQDDMHDVQPIGAAALRAMYEGQHVIGGGQFWITHS